MKFKVCKGIEMSPMEKIIHNELKSRCVVFHQEVTFAKCINPKTGKLLRYDFYIPDKNMLIEYDGKDYHEDEEVRYRDSIKSKFAKDNNITLIRLSGRKAISTFMSRIPVNKKTVSKKNPKKKKIKPKKEQKVLESAIEKYKAGKQAATKPDYQIRKERKAYLNSLKREKKVPKVSDWKPIPYKRIIIV